MCDFCVFLSIFLQNVKIKGHKSKYDLYTLCLCKLHSIVPGTGTAQGSHVGSGDAKGMMFSYMQFILEHMLSVHFKENDVIFSCKEET